VLDNFTLKDKTLYLYSNNSNSSEALKLFLQHFNECWHKYFSFD